MTCRFVFRVWVLAVSCVSVCVCMYVFMPLCSKYYEYERVIWFVVVRSNSKNAASVDTSGLSHTSFCLSSFLSFAQVETLRMHAYARQKKSRETRHAAYTISSCSVYLFIVGSRECMCAYGKQKYFTFIFHICVEKLLTMTISFSKRIYCKHFVLNLKKWN